MVEHDNLVVEADPEFRHLLGHRLLKIGKYEVVAEIKGPKTSDPTGSIVETTEENPDGVICMEWSNSLARVLNKAGDKVTCIFSGGDPWGPRTGLPEELKNLKQSNDAKIQIRRYPAIPNMIRRTTKIRRIKRRSGWSKNWRSAISLNRVQQSSRNSWRRRAN